MRKVTIIKAAEIMISSSQASLSLAEGDQLGLMIRGGAEFGLDIFVTGVLINSAAWKLGLQVLCFLKQ